MSNYTVKKVLKIYKKWGCVVDPWLKKAGRRKIFNGNDMRASVNYYKTYFYYKLS